MSAFNPLPAGGAGDGAWKTGKDTKPLLVLHFQSPLPPLTRSGDVCISSSILLENVCKYFLIDCIHFREQSCNFDIHCELLFPLVVAGPCVSHNI